MKIKLQVALVRQEEVMGVQDMVQALTTMAHQHQLTQVVVVEVQEAHFLDQQVVALVVQE